MDDMGGFEMKDIRATENKNLRTQIPENGRPRLEVYRSTTNPVYMKTQFLAAIAVSLGSLIVGFSLRYGFSALSKVDSNLRMSEWYQWIQLIGPIVGGVLGAPLFELLGRKITILATSIPFIISWLLIACTTNGWIVIVRNAISWLVFGVAFVSFRVYLVETTQPKVRGFLCLLPTALDSIATLLCVAEKRYMNWLAVAFLGGTLSVIFVILLVRIPETPRWYVSKGRKESAHKSLQWLRGKKADVGHELEGIVKSHADMGQLFKKCNLKPLLISLSLIFFQSFSGFNIVIPYFYRIFFDNGSTETVIVGGVTFAATLIAIVLIDRLGRKILLHISSIGMIITLGALGGFFYVEESGGNLSHLEWLRSYSLMGYLFCYSIGYATIPSLIMLEIVPTKIRGLAASLAFSFGSACIMISSKLFWNVQDLIGESGCYWVFAVICVTGFVFAIMCVPDTQGKSLEEIQREMVGRVQRISSVANIQPLSYNHLRGVV